MRASGKRKPAAKTATGPTSQAKYPRHSLPKALRIPRAILEQNAGRECSEREAAGFTGISYGGEFRLEVSSAIKFGLLERPQSGQIGLTTLAKKILRPQNPQDEVSGLRDAVLKAPDIADVYKHYRGENLPDQQFFNNALVDKFGMPQDKVPEFTEVFLESLRHARLIEEHAGKSRLLDVAGEPGLTSESTETLKKLDKDVSVGAGDSCFVMMPFARPYDDYYEKIYEAAIKKAGLKPIKADNEIFGTGKIMDHIWSGINSARVLVAELTTRNPNVFYELGLAHALQKPVVLVSSNESDVPFDLQHIRVIYYDVADPFWGDKLIGKISENIVSALKNPDEAIFKKAPS